MQRVQFCPGQIAMCNTLHKRTIASTPCISDGGPIDLPAFLPIELFAFVDDSATIVYDSTEHIESQCFYFIQGHCLLLVLCYDYYSIYYGLRSPSLKISFHGTVQKEGSL